MRKSPPNPPTPRWASTFAALRTLAAGAAIALLVAAPAWAEHTRWWKQSSFEDLDKGTAKGTAIRSDGKLFLAPRFTEFADANLAYLLDLRADAKGNLYAAGGSNAKVLRLDSSGKSTTVFESAELGAQTIALDASGNLYVGTSPDGKVYKVTPSGQSSVFFDPQTKYIWNLVVDRDGTVYVATGDTGKIFAVAPDGKGQVFYSSEETHIRTLALDSNGNVLAGTEPHGLVLRIPKAATPAAQREGADSGGATTNTRRAFVLYETAKKEITALAKDPAGNLYVAAVGEKTAPSLIPPRLPGAESATGASFGITVTGGAVVTTPIPQTQPTPFTPLFPTAISSSVYKIAADGSPEELWSSRDDLVYSLGFLPKGELLLGTGNQGAVLELGNKHLFSRLVKTASGQVTSIAGGPGGKLFLAAANPGKIFALGPDNQPEGTFESQPFDTRMFSRWGHIEWWGEGASAPANKSSARVEFFARSGNTSDPANNWSPWAGPYSNPSGDKLDCPAARFIQWKAVLHGTAGGGTPELDWVSLAYLPKNVAPEVTAIALQNPGIRLQGISLPASASSGQSPVQLHMPQPPNASPSFTAAFNTAAITNSNSTSNFLTPQGFAQKGYQAVLWTTEDPNDDTLEFAIYYRGENETAWKLLKDKLDVRYYSWDTTTMPDGAYYLKIVASDAPSNPPGDALTAERESDRFEVDNTPPVISQLTADPAAGSRGAAASVRVRFAASASATSITRAQYSVDAGEWTLVFPSGGLSDANRESYDFLVEKLAPGEHTITVRIYDQFENISTAKATVRVPASGN